VIIFQRVIVILDHSASEYGAPSLALDWARRLRLSIMGITLAAESEEIGRQFQRLCTRFGLACDLDPCKEDVAGELLTIARPGDVLIAGQALSHAQKKEVLGVASGRGGPALLFCPTNCEKPSRALLLNHTDDIQQSFLASAAAICHSLSLVPILLTVAGSRRAAGARQRAAQKMLDDLGIHADCDFIIGWEIRDALASVARWRACQLGIVPQVDAAPWWRRFSGSFSDWRTELTESLSLLTLPTSGGSAISVANQDVAADLVNANRQGRPLVWSKDS
jgi:hypothetical protein